jgi:hypothetical protein
MITILLQIFICGYSQPCVRWFLNILLSNNCMSKSMFFSDCPSCPINVFPYSSKCRQLLARMFLGPLEKIFPAGLYTDTIFAAGNHAETPSL